MSIKTDTRVGEVMISFTDTPKTASTTILKEALELMDHYRLGIVCITSKDGVLEGIITDGDIRRMLTRVQKPLAALMGDDVINHAIKKPAVVTDETLLHEAINLMGQKQVWDLPVVCNDGVLKGLLHLHPAIKAMMKDYSND